MAGCEHGDEVAAGRQTDEQEDRQVSEDPEVQKIQVSHTKHEDNKSLCTKYTGGLEATLPVWSKQQSGETGEPCMGTQERENTRKSSGGTVMAVTENMPLHCFPS